MKGRQKVPFFYRQDGLRPISWLLVLLLELIHRTMSVLSLPLGRIKGVV